MIDQDSIVNIPKKKQRDGFRLATVASVVTGGVTLRFDGDTAAGQKKYKFVTSYSPVVGHRVIVAMIGGSALVLGAVGTISDVLLASAPWLTWEPTLTGITVGNGTLVAKYLPIGKYIKFELSFTLGSTSAITGGFYFTLPSQASGADNKVGTGSFFDASATKRVFAIGLLSGSTNCYVRALKADANGYLDMPNISATSPWTWAAGDIISVTGDFAVA